MQVYEPEIGQIAFGNRWSDYECPEWFIALLRAFGDEIERITFNRDNGNPSRPMGNYGDDFVLPEFEAHSYVWQDCICPDGERIDPTCLSCRPNFRFGDLEVRWYKYLSRGTSINREIAPDEGVAIFEQCWAALQKLEKEVRKQHGLVYEEEE